MTATNALNLAQFLIIGSGRVARHLAHYFDLSNITYKTWDRAQDPHLLPVKIQEASHVLLAISDSALEGFSRKHLAGMGKTVVHFSGAKNISDAIAAHPLMTFTEELYPLEFYSQIHFALTGADRLDQALPGLKNTFSLVPAEDKALYHALCVAGGNFVTLLTSEMNQGLQKLNIPQAAVELYSQTIVHNALTQAGNALTGPIARKDSETVRANLQALQNQKLGEIYQAFLKTYWPEYTHEKRTP